MPTLNQSSTAKTLHSIQRTQGRHWVGDGFPVRTLLAYNSLGQTISPFLLLDYAGPATFPATTARRGVGEHPHRGFETVTIVYDGEVEHRDSAGGGGIIGPGDVQWMTAAAGLVHEEFHGPNFAKHGGPFEMVQLWVNLPAKDKMALPRYQGITADQIPVVELPDGQGSLRVIAGEFEGAPGPAQTFTPINMWDLRLTGGKQVNLTVPEGHTTLLVVLKGSVRVGDSEPIAEAEIGIFDPAGTVLTFEPLQDTTALLLSGEPIDEPIVGHGPFVMNTTEEIYQAVADYQNGKMGALVR
ncbi:pirin family protein [Nodosilinea sp. LEGE 06152]|uniref:pirin family protein n=1 Tax=Nodosilinea sp. LEGE 06152 TaxID=2777966 RepID=UPI00187FE448|nr:pirin family protein [Nodosilinea sp. LEGE 06152]MBE9158254.1 pirin family protein [Nodosilinea sp. LEGE 06152]